MIVGMERILTPYRKEGGHLADILERHCPYDGYPLREEELR